MAREEYYDEFGSSTPPGPGLDPDNHRIAAYLGFDRATYTDLKVPCQAIAATFFTTGISYHVADSNGVEWSVSKKQVNDLLEQGYYIWVCSPETKWYGGNISLQIQASQVQSAYKPIYKDILSPEALQKITTIEARHFKVKGRKRRYYANGRTGPGINMNRVRTPEQDQAAHQASDDVWARAHEQARGY